MMVDIPPASAELQACDLDAREASVLALAFVHPGPEAILDDLAGGAVQKS